ncbi:MAG: hypothetical protein MZV70_68660 [Desulfobacterales bacterium]|nr:hypothetical protein [Desulfobacterales bacterium]
MAGIFGPVMAVVYLALRFPVWFRCRDAWNTQGYQPHYAFEFSSTTAWPVFLFCPK